MARNYRPMRTVVVFFVGLAIAFGLVALAGSWTPRLGLDLQGGTRISLVASGEGVTQESLQEAATIIDSRVNGSGVSEAEVTTQGERTVVVEIPGEPRPEMEETVKRQAQLRFRVVACTSVDPGVCGGAAGTPQAPQQPQLPGSGVTVPSSPEPDSGRAARGAGRRSSPPMASSRPRARRTISRSRRALPRHPSPTPRVIWSTSR